jgi:mRNA interferase RelE/StbE
VTYGIRLSPAAARQLRKFDPQVRRRIQGVLELLADDPRPPAATRLVGGAGEWGVRTGDYRIVYEIEARELLVLVLRVGHRARSTGRVRSAARAVALSRAVGGVVHTGPSAFPLGDRLLALPICTLWSS